ncbi:hypothetical protein [Halocalculus aciditolerans]|uniref:Uncharacterized protein n=1 Tax=Halocalculus aciditolerans TaxID=1383812 RepID=A0A830FG88_9EURY|nr:hypothetical protein [Halocalculus aciditolerans]GGL52418.1 hypothetical protein GCM10009039_08370 [Halocalculus aciditolerans]
MQRTITIQNDNSVIESIGLTVGIELVQDVITATEPGDLRIVLVNSSKEKHSFSTGAEPVIGPIIGSEGENRLVLLPIDNRNPQNPSKGQPWHLNEVPAQKASINRFELDPGEATTKRLRIWDAPQNRSYLPKGEYEFAVPFKLFKESGNSEMATFNTAEEAKWWFTISLQNK